VLQTAKQPPRFLYSSDPGDYDPDFEAIFHRYAINLRARGNRRRSFYRGRGAFPRRRRGLQLEALVDFIVFIGDVFGAAICGKYTMSVGRRDARNGNYGISARERIGHTPPLILATRITLPEFALLGPT